ncbi:hypothetical protein [Helicobacter sp. MIT 14-3879]|uniref:hypothetical protein n=1 Tax=Helicobacter sp. MIT 14-3879 TaxID=2040649 RepID=UPI000E1F1F7A|nr:hypothetical protein [Helicobacter sp. MIT 14-3879]RDU63148.1 hypothetical protein CQA44_05780 [Helicobacter sp. MIT 14-3879]
MRFSILTPFFATLFMAIVFFYFQYSYTKLKIIDFSDVVFYGKDYIFSPSEKEYIIILYNSKSSNFLDIAKKVPNDSNLKILAIDYYQNTKQEIINNIIPLSAGINTLLKFNRIFRIDKIPMYFKIKQKNAYKFTQDSKMLEIN